MEITNQLSKELNIDLKKIEDTIKLLDEGNSVPFIARYRKEITGGLNDEDLRKLEERLNYLRNLNSRKEEILRLIDEQGKLTQEIKNDIENADVLSSLEDIYRPFKKKKNTRASIAKEKGYEIFSDMIYKGLDLEEIFKEIDAFIEKNNSTENPNEILQGACDIIAEDISDNPMYRKTIKTLSKRFASIVSQIGKNPNDIYKMYEDFSELIRNIPSHRILALNRGEKEEALKVNLVFPEELIFNNIAMDFLDGKLTDLKSEILKDALKRLILPSVERELRSDLTESAENESIELFGLNLKNLLMIRPLKDKVLMALDPGIRTGTKMAILDKNGKFLDNDVFYIAGHQGKNEENKILSYLEKYKVQVIAIGNGTASREVESFVADVLKKNNSDVKRTFVNEAGASIYSASKEGTEEFPDLDVTVRGAISIGRRLQDPLAELVKIEPKHIGVGQYQHDLNQKKLNEKLSGVVEDCVNTVGVNLNTASVSLLSYVSGISKSIAKNIVAYRDDFGSFKNRKELKNIKGLGPKAYEQSAGFLRILGGDEPLDMTAVHPESYEIARKLKGNEKANQDLAQSLNVGLYTLRDILEELKKPGRDPRDELEPVFLKSGLLSIEDLKIGDKLKGTVRNVVDFGCFVDIGLHDDGLVHISNLSEKFIKHPSQVVSVGDIIDVEVVEIDKDRNRIGLKKIK